LRGGEGFVGFLEMGLLDAVLYEDATCCCSGAGRCGSGCEVVKSEVVVEKAGQLVWRKKEEDEEENGGERRSQNKIETLGVCVCGDKMRIGTDSYDGCRMEVCELSKSGLVSAENAAFPHSEDEQSTKTWKTSASSSDLEIERDIVSGSATVLSGVTPMKLHASLKERDGGHGVLFIDARTRALFEMQHIHGAVHANMSSGGPGQILKDEAIREAAQGVWNLIRQRIADAEAPFEAGVRVVVYDQGSPNSSASYTRAVRLGNELIRVADANCSVQVLEGGFSRFSELFPDDCEGVPEAFHRNSELQFLLRARLGRSIYKRIVLKELKSELSNTMQPPSEILPYLFVGCQRDATNRANMESLGITHVLVVGEELREHFATDSSLTYKKLNMRDSVDEPLDQFFGEACEFLDGVRRQPGARVLVHCFAGRSRSVSITIFFLLYLNYTLRAAFELLRERRIGIAPNAGFMRTLAQYEQKRHGFSTRDEIQLDFEALDGYQKDIRDL